MLRIYVAPFHGRSVLYLVAGGVVRHVSRLGQVRSWSRSSSSLPAVVRLCRICIVQIHTQETRARSCRLYRSHPATRAISCKIGNRALKYLDHGAGTDHTDLLSEVWNVLSLYLGVDVLGSGGMTKWQHGHGDLLLYYYCCCSSSSSSSCYLLYTYSCIQLCYGNQTTVGQRLTEHHPCRQRHDVCKDAAARLLQQ